MLLLSLFSTGIILTTLCVVVSCLHGSLLSRLGCLVCISVLLSSLWMGIGYHFGNFFQTAKLWNYLPRFAFFSMQVKWGELRVSPAIMATSCRLPQVRTCSLFLFHTMVFVGELFCLRHVGHFIKANTAILFCLCHVGHYIKAKTTILSKLGKRVVWGGHSFWLYFVCGAHKIFLNCIICVVHTHSWDDCKDWKFSHHISLVAILTESRQKSWLP